MKTGIAILLSLFAVSVYAGQDKPVNCNKIAKDAEKTVTSAAREQFKADNTACAAVPKEELNACKKAAKAKQDTALRAAKQASAQAKQDCKASSKAK